jgi:pyruvate/2-oxoglutarate dehydrogenase complex dihydrolipoamide acyltransferase (E2) component
LLASSQCTIPAQHGLLAKAVCGLFVSGGAACWGVAIQRGGSEQAALCFMQDMSDDEKPLGWRAEEMESKPKKRRQSGTATKPAAAANRKAPPAKAASSAQQQRRRREAAAGVAAAVHAVAAVQAAVAADGEGHLSLSWLA